MKPIYFSYMETLDSPGPACDLISTVSQVLWGGGIQVVKLRLVPSQLCS